MGAIASASQMDEAVSALADAADTIEYVAATDESLCVAGLTGIAGDLSTLIDAAKANHESLGNDGAAIDLPDAASKLGEALTAARASDGADGSDGIGELLARITASMADVAGMHGQVEALRGGVDTLAGLLSAAREAAEALVTEAKRIQAATNEVSAELDAIRATAEEIAEAQRASVAR